LIGLNVALRLPKTKGMLRREAAGWLARLESGRDPDIDRKFRRWHDADPAHAQAFETVQRSYSQAGLLRLSRVLPGRSPSELSKPVSSTSWYGWAAAAALVIAIPAAWFAFSHGVIVRGTDAVMLATGVGEIKQVNLADGSKVTLDSSTKVDVEIGRSHRRAHK
jgi:transmembrane sensor